MASSTGIHCLDAAFFSRGVVSRKLILFLKKQGLRNSVVSARAINKSDLLILSLVPICHSVRKCGRHEARKLKAVSGVSDSGPSGSLPPNILYLLEIGFDLEQIETIRRNDPSFGYYSVEGNIRPLVEFLLDLGVSKPDLPGIVVRCPRLCGLSLSKSVIPKMEFLETLGVDKTKWVKVISRYPSFLGVSRQKVEAVVEFLYEMGLSEELVGKLLTRFPVILNLSIENQLRPKAEYFQSLGVDVAALLRRCPQSMGLSMEAKLVPKWEFFLTMDYSRRDLLKHPQYFSYSLEERIMPRYNLMKELGVKLSLCQLLIPNQNAFEVLLEKKIERLRLDKSCG